MDDRGDLHQWCGSGKRHGSFGAGYADSARYLYPFALYGYGRVEIHFQPIKKGPAFADEAPRRQLQARLNQIPGVPLGDNMLTLRPSIPLEQLATDDALDQFTAALDWAFARAAEQAR